MLNHIPYIMFKEDNDKMIRAPDLEEVREDIFDLKRTVHVDHKVFQENSIN